MSGVGTAPGGISMAPDGSIRMAPYGF